MATDTGISHKLIPALLILIFVLVGMKEGIYILYGGSMNENGTDALLCFYAAISTAMMFDK